MFGRNASHHEEWKDGSEDNLLGRKFSDHTITTTPTWKTIAILTATAAMALMAGTLVYIATQVHGMQQHPRVSATGIELGDCGASHTVEEARAKGCKFDPMSWLWVQPACYDADLIDDFMNKTDWSWHTDWHLTPETQVPLDVVFSGEHPQLFTKKSYHAIHCTYMWEKMHKAMLEHRPVDSDLTSWHHTHHCNMVLLDDVLHEDSNCTAEMICPTLVRATWTSCGYV